VDALPAAEDVIAKALDRISKVSSYAEAVAESSRGSGLRLDREQISPTSLPSLKGVAFRAWSGALWLDVASSGLDAKSVGEAAEELMRRCSNGHTGTPPPGLAPTGRGEKRTTSQRPVGEVPVEEQVAWAKHCFETARTVPGILNTIVILTCLSNERLFLSSSGARRHQFVERLSTALIPLAIENGKVEYDVLIHGSTGGWEGVAYNTEEKIVETAKNARALLTAPQPPSGTFPVLLDPSTAGTFAHESFGHGTEADQFLRDRSYLKPHLGERVGPECLTLADDGALPGAWGSFFYDDEGTPTQRTVMVEKGEFVEVLHDRETAAAMRRKPTGNARRADFLSREFVRMTNTLVDPGDWSFEELLKEAKNGVLLEVCTSGMEDPLGGQMQIKVKRGHLIEHGELGAPVSAMALSGKVLDFLRNVKGVGKKEYFEVSPGYCGKGHTDLIPAGTAGSYLLSEAIVGPT
jgi:TldD protein